MIFLLFIYYLIFIYISFFPKNKHSQFNKGVKLIFILKYNIWILISRLQKQRLLTLNGRRPIERRWKLTNYKCNSYKKNWLHPQNNSLRLLNNQPSQVFDPNDYLEIKYVTNFELRKNSNSKKKYGSNFFFAYFKLYLITIWEAGDKKRKWV